MKIGKDAISDQRDALRTKPRKVKPPRDSSTIDTKDKEIDPYGRTSFITEDEEQRQRRIRTRMQESKEGQRPNVAKGVGVRKNQPESRQAEL
jgi:hypothetical protein